MKKRKKRLQKSTNLKKSSIKFKKFLTQKNLFFVLGAILVLAVILIPILNKQENNSFIKIFRPANSEQDIPSTQTNILSNPENTLSSGGGSSSPSGESSSSTTPLITNTTIPSDSEESLDLDLTEKDTNISEIPEDSILEENSECFYSDSDSGLNKLVKGTCDDKKAFLNTDSCESDIMLKEFYLDSNCTGCKSTLINCSNYWSTCVNGACVPKKAEHSDGGGDTGDNPWVQGTCQDATGLYTEVCASKDGTLLLEYFVDIEYGETDNPNAYTCSKKTLTCNHGCKDGACVYIGEYLCDAMCMGTLGIHGDCVSYNPRGTISKEVACSTAGMAYPGPNFNSTCFTGYLCCCNNV